MFKHFKLFILLYFVISLNPKIYCQEISLINQKTFGGNSNDFSVFARITSDKGFVVGGYSNSGNNGDKTEISRGYADYWIVKFDSLLTEVWQKTIGGNKDDILRNAYCSSDGGTYCVGVSVSPISGDKTVSNFSADTSDFWIVKLGNDGNIKWQQVYGGYLGDDPRSIIELEDHSVLIAGNSSSNISGTKTENSKGYTDYWVIKADSSGNVLWDKTIGGDSYESLSNLTCDSNGNIYLSGTSMSSISGDKTENPYGSIDIWVVKLDSLGNKLWDKTIGGSGTDNNGFIVSKLNSLYVISSSSSNISGTKSENSKGQTDFWITKLDNNGNILWDKTVGGSSYDNPSSILITDDYNILISGNSLSGISGDKTEGSNGSFDFWLVCLDTLGNIKWQKTIGGNDYDALSNSLEISPLNYLLVGYSKSNISGDKTDVCRGQEDYWLVQLNITTLINNDILNETTFSYPNPVKDKLYIKLDDLREDLEIDVYDIYARRIISENIKSSYIELNLSNLKPGIYMYNIVNNMHVISTGKFIKE